MRVLSWRCALAMLLCAVPALAVAQTGAIAGRVTSSTGEAVAQAQVRVLVGRETRAAATADASGQYRVIGLAAGRYTVLVQRVGAQLSTIDNVVVRDGQTTTLDVTMTPAAAQLQGVIIAASGRVEKVVDAPADATSLPARAIASRPSLTIADHVKSVPGVDVSAGGIAQSNIVTRGFNNAFSGTLLALQDYRFATVPSLRVNVPFLFTSINEDIERVEIVLGPAAALYGPNSSHGVMHIVTKSPFDSPGGTVTLDGGSRAIARGSLRYAGIINPKAAFKISGEAMRGEDWHYQDPGEPTNLTHDGKPVTRDFDVNRVVTEARLDLRPRDGLTLTSTYGLSHIGSAIELTGANGAAQVRGWTYQNFQQRMSWGNFFAQAFINMSDAGNTDSLDQKGTFLLRTGTPIVDQSRTAAGSIQHSFEVAGGRQRFIYGGDYTWTNPRTGGTINGLNEDNDNITEYGGYVHSLTKLSDRVELTAAIRADRNDRLDGTFFSPRAALVFKPSDEQNVRFTYNRAYSTPSNFSMFLDLIQVRNAGGLPFNVRAMGVPPEGGWDYRRSCAQALAAGLCMRSPFPSALGAPNTWVDANAAAYYPAVFTAIKSQLPQSVQPLIPILEQLSPTSAQVGSVMRYLVGGTGAVNPSSLTPIEPLKASFVNNYEVGYKGMATKSTRFSASGWYQERINFVAPAQVATPNVFMDPTSLGAYLGTSITQALIAQGMPAAQAQATAAEAAPQLAAAIAQVPTGTVTFDDEKLANRTDVLFTYRNVDKTIELWGLDFGFDQTLNDRFSVSGTYSFVSKDSFPDIVDAGGPLRINSPKHKGTLTGKFTRENPGITLELRARYNDSYAINSGVYASGVNFSKPGQTCSSTNPDGCYTYEPIPAATFLDAGFTWELPRIGKGALWSITATNLLDNRAPSFIGVPALGLMVMTRLQYTF